MGTDIAKRPYITVGMAALLCLIPLAATSTSRMIKRLGAPAWRRLHRLAYAAGDPGQPALSLAGQGRAHGAVRLRRRPRRCCWGCASGMLRTGACATGSLVRERSREVGRRGGPPRAWLTVRAAPRRLRDGRIPRALGVARRGAAADSARQRRRAHRAGAARQRRGGPSALVPRGRSRGDRGRAGPLPLHRAHDLQGHAHAARWAPSTVWWRGWAAPATPTPRTTTCTSTWCSRRARSGRASTLLADIAVNASFPPDEITSEKKVVFEEMNVLEDDPDKALVRRLYELGYEPYPYGRPILGTRKDIEALTRDQLVRYYKKYYVPRNTVLVVVGAVKPSGRGAHGRGGLRQAHGRRGQGARLAPGARRSTARAGATCAARRSRPISGWPGGLPRWPTRTSSPWTCSPTSSVIRPAPGSTACCATRKTWSTPSTRATEPGSSAGWPP